MRRRLWDQDQAAVALSQKPTMSSSGSVAAVNGALVAFDLLLRTGPLGLAAGFCFDGVEPSQLQWEAGQLGLSLLQFLLHQPSLTPELMLTHDFLSP